MRLGRSITLSPNVKILTIERDRHNSGQKQDSTTLEVRLRDRLESHVADLQEDVLIILFSSGSSNISALTKNRISELPE